MKVVNIARTSIPSESANAIHLMKLSEELNRLYNGELLVIVNHILRDKKEICNKYGVESFDIESIEIDDTSKLSMFSFAKKAVKYAKRMKI